MPHKRDVVHLGCMLDALFRVMHRDNIAIQLTSIGENTFSRRAFSLSLLKKTA